MQELQNDKKINTLIKKDSILKSFIKMIVDVLNEYSEKHDINIIHKFYIEKDSQVPKYTKLILETGFEINQNSDFNELKKELEFWNEITLTIGNNVISMLKNLDHLEKERLVNWQSRFYIRLIE